MSGVTVRTLHHYDEIGLLVPSGRTAAGYRRYSEDDLERLRQILTYRELGFSLEEVSTILDEPVDALAQLRRQHGLLLARIERLRTMVEAVEFMMEARQMGVQLTAEERFELFGDVDPEQYAAETEQRWGGTEAYRESQRRAAAYTKQDWQRMKEEAEQLYRELAEAMAAGVAATDERAAGLAEQHRQQISRWFYECGYDIHKGLSELYVTDERFTASIDRYAAGLAAYLAEAIRANADRAAS